MALYLDSKFEFVIQIAVWLVISNNETLKCSRPDSKGGDVAGRYVMWPRATDYPNFRGQISYLKDLISRSPNFKILICTKINSTISVFQLVISVWFAVFITQSDAYNHSCCSHAALRLFSCYLTFKYGGDALVFVS